MYNYKKIVLGFGITLCSLSPVFAQGTAAVDGLPSSNDTQKFANQYWKQSLVPDGVISRVEHDYRVAPWKTIRENDIGWYHRVWKVIPVREKVNAPFMYQGDEFSNGGAFIEILNYAIRRGDITAYAAGNDDRFTTLLSMDDLEKRIGGGIDTIEVYNGETEEYETSYTQKEFRIDHVTRYLVKEDWMFDRNSGRVQKRIIGIAPIIDIYEGSVYTYSQPLYWIYYPDAREILGKYEVYNPKNMIKRMTWSDYLEGNYYSSFVEKYSKNNPSNKSIKPANNVKANYDLRALREGERVIEDLLNQELDMWEK